MFARLGLLTLGCLILCGCASSYAPELARTEHPAGGQTLYDRLGGAPGIYSIADNLVETSLQDPRVNLPRTGHPRPWDATPDNVIEMKMYMAQYIGMLAGGPQAYEGRDLAEAHRGTAISEAEWLAFMDDLKKCLDGLQIPIADQQDLMRRIARSHDQIVNR